MPYPNITGHISKNDLIEYFTLHTDDFNLLRRVRQDSNRLGFADLLKSFSYLGYPPREKNDIPTNIIGRIVEQVGLSIDLSESYNWGGRSWDYHLSIIRGYTGFKPFDADDTPPKIPKERSRM